MEPTADSSWLTMRYVLDNTKPAIKVWTDINLLDQWARSEIKDERAYVRRIDVYRRPTEYDPYVYQKMFTKDHP